MRVWGMGGRQTRVGPQFGDAWDHHAIVFEYANGTRLFAYCRQQDGCVDEISDRFFGTKGRCDLLRCQIEGETNWRYTGPECNRFDLEHVALFSAIRSGKPINNGLYMARSSMLAIMVDLGLLHGPGDHLGAGDQLATTCGAQAAWPWTPTRRPSPTPSGNYPIAKPGIGPLML